MVFKGVLNSRLRLMMGLFVCSLILSTSCSKVSVRKPVAGSLPKLDPAQINGVWAGDGYAVATRIKDASAGVVEAAFLSQSADRITVDRAEAILRETPVGIIASVRDTSSPGLWNFARVKITSNNIIIFGPDVDSVGKLVRGGQLRGNFTRLSNGSESNEPILEQLGSEEFKYIQQSGYSPVLLFAADPGAVLIKIRSGSQ